MMFSLVKVLMNARLHDYNTPAKYQRLNLSYGELHEMKGCPINLIIRLKLVRNVK
jgi:hypothetical protein